MSTKMRHALTDAQRRMYAQEREENFRWIYTLLASRFPRALTPQQLVPVVLRLELAELGQFAEVAHGSLDPPFIWENLAALTAAKFPLEGYNALEGSTLHTSFRGSEEELQGYVAYRHVQKQIIVAFSGTTSLRHVWHELKVCLRRHPHMQDKNAKVHSGFWRLYSDVRSYAIKGLRTALERYEVDEIVVTGHSLGGVMSSLFVLDILAGSPWEASFGSWKPSEKITMITFGAPRLGNRALADEYDRLAVQFRKENGDDCLREYIVRGYNDGVPCLPPTILGYAHLHANQLYLQHGNLYNLDPDAAEYCRFNVVLDESEDAKPPEFPRGGHNYYNGRDMEKCLRQLQWLDSTVSGEAGWEDRYLRRLTGKSH